MALTKVTGQVIKNTTDVTVGVLTVTNTLAVGGTVSIGGTLTYEDVTNVDAVGLVTARNGIVVGSGITLSKDGDGFFTGVTTATTFSGAVAVSGANITLQDSGGASDDRLTFGAGTDLSIYHDGTDSEIKESTGNLNIICNSSQAINLKHGAENMLRAITDGAVELYYDNSKKLETTSSGVTLVDGLLLDNATNAGRDVQWQPANDRLAFLDNTKATFGNELDLSIYHDGSNSYIDETGTGGLLIRSGNIYLRNPSNADMIHAQSGGYVKLYHNGSEKLTTASYGVSTDGLMNFNGTGDKILIADDGKISFGGGGDLDIYHSGGTNYCDIASGQQLYFRVGGSNKFYVQSGGAQFVGSLYADDSNKIELGSSQDLQIFFDGSNSYIKEPNSVAGQLIIDGYNGTDIRRGATGDHMIRAIGAGAVELYHNASLKFSTESDGASTQGLQRFADDSGAVGGFTHCLTSGTISNGATFTAQTYNCHAGGLVTITTNRRPSGSNNKNISVFPIVINSTSNASLGSALSSMSGSSGSSFSVTGTSRGVIVTNTSGNDQKVSVRFDIAGI